MIGVCKKKRTYWDEGDEEDGIELEGLETVEDDSRDVTEVVDGSVGIEEDEDDREEGSDVSEEEVGETGEDDSSCVVWVGETTGVVTGELVERPWRLCSHR